MAPRVAAIAATGANVFKMNGFKMTTFNAAKIAIRYCRKIFYPKNNYQYFLGYLPPILEKYKEVG